MVGQQPVDSATIYFDVIVNSTKKSDLPSAINFFERRKRKSLAAKDTLNILYAMRMIAIGTFNEGNFFESEQEATEGLALIEGKSDKVYDNPRVGLYTQLGMVNRSGLDFEGALQKYTQALLYNPSPKERTNLLNNMGNVYKSMGDYKQSKAYLLKALEVAETIENVKLQAVVLDNLGEVQKNLNDPQAFRSLHKARRLRAQSNNLRHKYTSYMSLGGFYLKSNPDSATYYAKRAVGISDSLQNDSYKKEALKLLLQLNPNEDAREFIKISDSIATAQQLDENKYAYRKYNFSKAEKQALHAERQKEEERSKRILYQWIGILVVFIGILLFFVIRLKHKRDRVQEVYKTETRISKKVHDEVANDLYKIMAKIQTSQGTNETLLDDLDAVYHKTRDISKETSLIQIQKDFGNVLRELLLAYQNSEVNVLTKNLGAIDWTVISDLKKITLYRVLQELMTNMRKHSKASIVVISAQQTKNSLHIIYTDNGVGTELKKGAGLQNAENRIRSIQGTLIFESTYNKGVTVKISI
jgi:tetratricopeptide (TPR) repeat protein